MPHPMPLAIEPSASPAMRTPDKDLAPAWSANATRAISSVPSTAPTAAPTTKSTRNPRVRIADGPLRFLVPGRRRLGPALRGEEQAADGREGERGDDAGGGMAGGGQERDQDRADDEDELVDDRLHRQRRRQPVTAPQQVGPADP